MHPLSEALADKILTTMVKLGFLVGWPGITIYLWNEAWTLYPLEDFINDRARFSHWGWSLFMGWGLYPIIFGMCTAALIAIYQMSTECAQSKRNWKQAVRDNEQKKFNDFVKGCRK